eukprot:TRINITY_DN1671_c0_g1_i2.p1 TRINITY_DN1671_c0_g1~~TRINITY_DN1671_c0_g1_i2.p1  ORF type:complete len:209 (+),score=66.76 TRINITY_DN1671_c0_g1_i2:91-717(+)
MKVTITPEAFPLRKELMQYTMRDESLEKVKNNTTFPLTAIPNSSTLPLLPAVKSVTGLRVKSPRIRVSDAFAVKYSTLNKLPSGIPETRRAEENTGELENTQSYLKSKMALALAKAKNAEEMRKAEINYRKLTNLHDLQLKRWENMFIKVKQMRDDAEAKQAEKVEKFRFQFDDMTMKFEEQLLVDTRKRRLKAVSYTHLTLPTICSV